MIHCINSLEDSTDYAVEEGISLVHTLDLNVEIEIIKFNIRRISPGTYLGKGRVQKIKEYIEEYKPAFIFWNQNIQHTHQRELEREWKIKIYDRTRIILDIFNARAKSAEEKTQIGLAYKEYELARVTHAWSHLERQRGNLGKTGGPGEKQLELDKRMILHRIKIYKNKLRQIKQNREVQRRQRLKVPIIAIVGYTNVGKSTLFNLLTKSSSLVEDKLFATLNPHTRKAFFHGIGNILISDTVGFIRKFPASLENAFAATLEENRYASLILFVRTSQMPFEERYSKEIIRILKKVGADSIPIIHVWNKIDLETPKMTEHDGMKDGQNNAEDAMNHTDSVYISAKTGQGVDQLRSNITKHLLDIIEKNKV